MFKRTEFEIGKGFEDVLGSASLDRFDRFINADLGIVVRSKRGQEVRKIEIETEHVRKLFYLKHCTSRASEAFAALWQNGKLPCERELAMIRTLQEHEVPVMRPAAWGSRSVLGMSREGFLLVEAVDGQEVTDLFGRADQRLRLRLVRAMGSLLGRLNGLGFFQRIRLRDLICTEIPDPDRAPVRLVLIDREATRVRPQRFSTARCIDCLARCYCKLIQLRHRLDAPEMSSFAGSYMAALEGRGSLRRRDLINRTRRRVETLTAPGEKYQHLRDAGFAEAPGESNEGWAEQMQPIDTSRFHWTFVAGAAVPAAALSVVESLNQSEDRRGRVLHVTDGGNHYLLKLRSFTRLKDRLGATCGQSSLIREAAMLAEAGSAGLPVAELVGQGARRKCGLIREQGLLTAWLADRTPLRQSVVAATQVEDEAAIEAARHAYIRLLARVRHAGLGDRDFGVGNVLVQERENAPSEPVWTDLEAVFRAPPQDVAATGATVAAALVSWWVATGGHTRWFEATFRSVLDLLPEPAGGWTAALPRLNRTLERRMAKQLRHRRIDRAPAPLCLEIAGPG